MSPAAWLYAIGISVSLTAALIWAAKAVHCMSQRQVEPRTSSARDNENGA